MADQTYKIVLERYPNSVKLLRAYAGFLETVNNDPWAAAKYYALADKQVTVWGWTVFFHRGSQRLKRS